jgi:hypothetical protein
MGDIKHVQSNPIAAAAILVLNRIGVTLPSLREEVEKVVKEHKTDSLSGD